MVSPVNASVKNAARYRSGQLAIILTLVVPSLIAALTLGLDVTTIYLGRIRLQRSVDAAVLAAAGYLPSNPELAIKAVQAYANRDGLGSAAIVCTRISQGRAIITISAHRAVNCYFAHAIGLAPAPISATATATVVVSSLRARAVAIGIRYQPSMIVPGTRELGDAIETHFPVANRIGSREKIRSI
jgi:Flp pilus assembly protein TadG